MKRGQSVNDWSGIEQQLEREKRIYQLRAVIESIEIDPEASASPEDEYAENARAAFSEMLSFLEGDAFRVLTPKQKKWVEGELERRGIPLEKPKSAAEIPLGDPVELAPVLRNLPKKPPGRK